MAITAESGDYLIVSGINKPILVKCIEFSKKNCSGYLDVPSKSDDSKSVSFAAKEIIANLGKYPRAGSAFGVKVEPLIRTIKDKRFKEIRIYQKMKDERLDSMMDQLKVFWDVIKQAGHRAPYELEIRNPQGKYQGYYKHLPKAERDILCLKPEGEMPDFQYIAFHEHGHGVWFRRINDKVKTKWIKCYHNYVLLQDADEDTLNQIVDDLHAQGSLRDYLKDAEEETKLIINACIKHVGQVHNISKFHLEKLLNLQEDIGDYWPTFVEFSEKQVAISDYSRKSPEEFFAEAYAFHQMGRPLPQKVDKLLNSTLASLIK
jgi:hypothetical protein